MCGDSRALTPLARGFSRLPMEGNVRVHDRNPPKVGLPAERLRVTLDRVGGTHMGNPG
jgi:hypothetical protein